MRNHRYAFEFTTLEPRFLASTATQDGPYFKSPPGPVMDPSFDPDAPPGEPGTRPPKPPGVDLPPSSPLKPPPTLLC